jgi:hypothetical protein
MRTFKKQLLCTTYDFLTSGNLTLTSVVKKNYKKGFDRTSQVSERAILRYEMGNL